MNSKRRLVNVSYTLLALWWFLYWACTKYYIIVLPPVFLIYFGSLPVFILLAVTLFNRSKRWLSEARIVAVLLIIPFIWVFIGQQFVDQAKLRIFPPTEDRIRSFLHRGAGSGVEDRHIDKNEPIAFYNKKTKQLDIHVRFQSEAFLDWFFNKTFTQHKTFEPEQFVGYLRKYYVFPEKISEITLVPKKIFLYGYWDNTQIVENHFTLIENSYRMDPPHSQLKLVIHEGDWYLEYKEQNVGNRIFLTHEKEPINFEQDFW